MLYCDCGARPSVTDLRHCLTRAPRPRARPVPPSSPTLLSPFPVFIALFNLPTTYKKKTSHKLTIEEFRAACGSYGLPNKSVRHDTLRISGEGVGVRWKAEENTAVVGGTYGKEGCGKV